MTVMTKRGSIDNIVTYTHICDTTADLQAIDPKYSTLGSVALVINDGGIMCGYMANSEKKWVPFSVGAKNNQNEDDNPDEEEDETMIVRFAIDKEAYNTNGSFTLIQPNAEVTNNILTAIENNKDVRIMLALPYSKESYSMLSLTGIDVNDDHIENLYFTMMSAFKTNPNSTQLNWTLLTYMNNTWTINQDSTSIG